MSSPSGSHYLLTGGGHRAVVTESGGALRLLERDGVPLVDGFAESEMSSGGRGQLLMPWPNRIRDGAYSFGGRDLRLPLTEPALGNASHGLVRWAPWTVEQHRADRLVLGLRLMAQPGYPWRLDLSVRYTVSDRGLEVSQSATNVSAEPAPYACGAHPYLTVGDGRVEESAVDDWELTVPAATTLRTDDRKLPVGRDPVAGTALDFRVPRPVGDTSLDHTFTDLERADDGTVEVQLRHGDRSVVLWGDRSVRCLQLYTADDRPGLARRSLGVEPMTAPPDAFRSGEGLVVLQPGGTSTTTWGIRGTG